MNGFEIERAFQFNKKNRERFGGIYNVSNFKLKLNKRLLCSEHFFKDEWNGTLGSIINIKNKLYFFDSFAKRAEFYGGGIEYFFSSYSDLKAYLLNHMIESNLSFVCGAYLIYFAYHVCNRFTIQDLISRFSLKNRLKNDKMVERFKYIVTKSTVVCNTSLCPKIMFEHTCMDECNCLENPHHNC